MKTFDKIMVFCFILFLTIILMDSESMASDKKYSVTSRSDGGYKLEIYVKKRHWKPITAEGFFPKEEKSYVIEIVGKGTNWDYRAHNGYFYSLDKIKSVKKHWDIGYAWVDKERKNIYINFFWVDSPDGLKPSDINGKYTIKKQ